MTESQGKTAEKPPRLLNQVRTVLRLHHYSRHMERAYVDWIRHYVHFHRMRRRQDLAGANSDREGRRQAAGAASLLAGGPTKFGAAAEEGGQQKWS